MGVPMDINRKILDDFSYQFSCELFYERAIPTEFGATRLRFVYIGLLPSKYKDQLFSCGGFVGVNDYPDVGDMILQSEVGALGGVRYCLSEKHDKLFLFMSSLDPSDDEHSPASYANECSAFILNPLSDEFKDRVMSFDLEEKV